ncbi:cap22 protein [Colletotrichum truncatum]|uniref:Cap22 protein n=1 Tax=Colletotrichum truncatum TaxID=5467 RepID=A0ACC3Z857_COLTU
MQYKIVALSLAAAVVNADLRLGTNDIPQDCNAICRPIRDLGNVCTVNFIPGQGNNNSDQTQDQLDAQCVCTNTSFDVKNLAAQCSACMAEKVPNDQQRSLEGSHPTGINSIMSVCDFQSTSYASSATSIANTVIVLATRLTASSQLTTTLGGGATPAPSNTRSAITTTFLTSNGAGFPSVATSVIGGGQTGSPNAAAGVVAPGSNSLLGAAGLAVAGAFALGAFML